MAAGHMGVHRSGTAARSAVVAWPTRGRRALITGSFCPWCCWQVDSQEPCGLEVQGLRLWPCHIGGSADMRRVTADERDAKNRIDRLFMRDPDCAHAWCNAAIGGASPNRYRERWCGKYLIPARTEDLLRFDCPTVRTVAAISLFRRPIASSRRPSGDAAVRCRPRCAQWARLAKGSDPAAGGVARRVSPGPPS